MLSIVDTDFLIFDNVIRKTLKVPLIRIILSIGSSNGKKIAFWKVIPEIYQYFHLLAFKWSQLFSVDVSYNCAFNK